MIRTATFSRSPVGISYRLSLHDVIYSREFCGDNA
jgi:hypothetical protein